MASMADLASEVLKQAKGSTVENKGTYILRKQCDDGLNQLKCDLVLDRTSSPVAKYVIRFTGPKAPSFPFTFADKNEAIDMFLMALTDKKNPPRSVDLVFEHKKLYSVCRGRGASRTWLAETNLEEFTIGVLWSSQGYLHPTTHLVSTWLDKYFPVDDSMPPAKKHKA